MHEETLRTRLVEGLRQVDGVRVQRIWHDSPSSVGIVTFTFTFTVAGLDAGLVAAVLRAEHGIGVRDGRFCAHPLLARLGLPDGAVRAGVGVGTGSEDVDRLVDAVRSLVADGAALRYALVEGRWAPVDDPRALPAWLHDEPGPGVGSPCSGG